MRNADSFSLISADMLSACCMVADDRSAIPCGWPLGECG